MPTDEAKIKTERNYQQGRATSLMGEVIEALRILNNVADPGKDNNELDKVHDDANKLCKRIMELEV